MGSDERYNAATSAPDNRPPVALFLEGYTGTLVDFGS